MTDSRRRIIKIGNINSLIIAFLLVGALLLRSFGFLVNKVPQNILYYGYAYLSVSFILVYAGSYFSEQDRYNKLSRRKIARELKIDVIHSILILIVSWIWLKVCLILLSVSYPIMEIKWWLVVISGISFIPCVVSVFTYFFWKPESAEAFVNCVELFLSSKKSRSQKYIKLIQKVDNPYWWVAAIEVYRYSDSFRTFFLNMTLPQKTMNTLKEIAVSGSNLIPDAKKILEEKVKSVK